MLQLIGIMGGLYIFTRMLATVLQPNTHGAIVASAILTMVVVGFGLVALLIGGDALLKLVLFPAMFK